MKARAKMLLGLVIALAMMIFAAPAMAQEAQTSPNFTVSGIPDTLEVELGSEVKFNYTITKTDQTKKLSYGDEDTLTAENRPAEGDEKLSFMHTTPFQMEGDNNNTGEVIIKPDHVKQLGEHAFKFNITEYDDEHDPRYNPISKYEKVIKITVKPKSAVSLSASLSGYDTVTNGANQLTKTVEGVGANTGLTASTTAQNPSYQWQKAADQRNAFEPNAENWEDIPNANTAALGNATDDMNGQYVRCVVTVGNEKMVATANESGLSDNAAVKIVFSNTTDLVCKVYATVNGQKREAQNEYQYIFFEWVDKKISDDGKLTAEASGGKRPYSYEWEKIEGEIDPKIAFSYMNELEIGTIGGLYDDSFVGTYRCKVTDSDNRTAYSKPIKFSYAKPQTLKIKQGDCTVAYFEGINNKESAIYSVDGKGVVNVAEADLNKPLTLEAEATQRQPTGYKWYKNNTEIPNATGASYTIPANEVKVGDKYKVEAAFDNGLLSKLYCEIEIKSAHQDNGADQDSVEVKIFENVKVSETEAIAKEAPANKTFYIGETNHTFFPKVINDTDEGDHQYAYHWLKDGKDIALTDIVVSDKGDLFFDKITSNLYAGTYQCLVTENNVVVGRSPIITVQVAEGPAKQQPTKELYTMTPAEAEYDGKTHKPTITPAEGAGEVEKVHYYLDGKEITGEPKDVGTYTVKIDTKVSDNYEAGKELEIGTFTIKEKSDEPDKPTGEQAVVYRTHVQNVGWQPYVTNGTMAGTSNQSLRLEAMNINLQNQKYAGDIEYRTHVQNIGWESEWKKNDDMSGTSGQELRLEAMQVRLTGAMAEHYDVYYRVHAQNIGWMNWAKNGEQAGTAGYGYRLEAMQIMLVDKGGAAPTIAPNAQTDKHFTEKYKDNVKADSLIAYQTHVQNVGWQDYAADGGDAGTSGQSLRLEGMKIYLNNPKYTGDIEYRTHIQNIGWENEWKKNDAMSGTSGQALRLEAMQVRLTGEMAEHYDVYYRVHAQNIGWMNWAKNGEQAGTAGYGYRLEAMQVVLVDKGGAAPALAPNPDSDQAFVQK